MVKKYAYIADERLGTVYFPIAACVTSVCDDMRERFENDEEVIFTAQKQSQVQNDCRFIASSVVKIKELVIVTGKIAETCEKFCYAEVKRFGRVFVPYSARTDNSNKPWLGKGAEVSKTFYLKIFRQPDINNCRYVAWAISMTGFDDKKGDKIPDVASGQQSGTARLPDVIRKPWMSLGRCIRYDVVIHVEDGKGSWIVRNPEDLGLLYEVIEDDMDHTKLSLRLNAVVNRVSQTARCAWLWNDVIGRIFVPIQQFSRGELQYITNPFINMIAFVPDLVLGHRRQIANPFTKRERMRKCPTLTADHKKARMDFVRAHMPWTRVTLFFNVHVSFQYRLHFIQVIFSDKKKFSLGSPDGFTSYWRDLRKERRIFSTRNFEGGSLMVWAAFSSIGALKLVFVSTKMNSVDYQQVLENQLLLYHNKFPQRNIICQQDNSVIHGGHGCGHCQAGTVNAHPASNMVDGNTSWWQSPPLSRGMEFNHVNITIDLEQEFHVAYVWIQMANSPKPGTWILERSTDYGKTFQPWYYFAETPAECMRRFGMESLSPISEDGTVVCRSDLASIHPLENADMVIKILEHRPSRNRFSSSEALQNFTRATNVRIRLLGTRTLHGDLMDLYEGSDPTVTRRYFYSIKEILMGGRCVCNGHAGTCDILDPKRPRTKLCRCEHNTCGDMCERCCPGFEQKKWEPTTVHNNFTCEPCNCFGRSNECEYDESLDKNNLSLDIYGNYEGGGRCLNCRVNPFILYFSPSAYAFGTIQTIVKSNLLFRIILKALIVISVCLDSTALKVSVGTTPCHVDVSCYLTNDRVFIFIIIQRFFKCACDPTGSVHSNCSALTGQCICASAFSVTKLSAVCNCDPLGTEGGVCDSTSGQCLCKQGFSGENCDQCDSGYYGYPNCKECGCTVEGARSVECDASTGQCPCHSNFTARKCDKCAAGFYDYPNCKACSCLIEGAKGRTCDNNGQCYCKGNFQGERCDLCKPNFYNFPACEECNCHPSGVTTDFAGCDKVVAPGELCSCRKHVIGRICDQCKPTFWDLQYHYPGGCVECDCYIAGTLSMLNTCNQNSGQCICKRNVAGRRCDKCKDGYYNLQSFNQLGCQPCTCDVGGALRSECDVSSGQCRCRPRVTGLRCDKPIENHYFPTLWHNQYEAEEGHTDDNRPIRFAIDSEQFPSYSWRGYAQLFSQFATSMNLTIIVEVIGFNIISDIEQSEKTTFVPTTQPSIKEITVSGKPFVLNPGKWEISIAAKQRLFLDFVVVLPAEYYEGSALKEHTSPPCEAHLSHNSTCTDLLYPPLTTAARAEASETTSFREVNFDGTTTDLQRVPIEILPEIIGPAAFVRADNNKRIIEAIIDIPDNDEYCFVVEHHSLKKHGQPIVIEISQDTDVKLNGSILVHYCPYATFCREVVSDYGTVPFVHLTKGLCAVQLFIKPMQEFGLAAINIIKKKDWSSEYLEQVFDCNITIEIFHVINYVLSYDIVKKAASLGIILSDMLFHIFKKNFLPILKGTMELSGVVPTRGHYMFLVHYFNQDNTPLNIDVLLQNDHFFQETKSKGFPYDVTVLFAYCPSASGCRALMKDKDKSEVNESSYFVLFTKFHKILLRNLIFRLFSFGWKISILPHSSIILVKKDLFLSIIVPQMYPISVVKRYFHLHQVLILQHFPVIVMRGVRNHFAAKSMAVNVNVKQISLVDDVIDVHRDTTIFQSALVSIYLEFYVKVLVFGKLLEMKYLVFRNFLECKCSVGEHCDEQTGQCFCPPHVEGTACDRCVGSAFGYDPLIGCQKDNVGGTSCEICKAGTFDLSSDNQQGCIECFCFGTTDQCRSSNYPVSIISVDMSAFTTTDTDGNVTVDDDIVTYTGNDHMSTGSIYFVVPIEYGADYTNSYGLMLSFKISVMPRPDRLQISTDPDIRIQGNNMTAEYWALEQPANPQETFTVKVKLVPPMSRDDLMMMLHSLQNITLKASYYINPLSVNLIEFGLEVAGKDFSHSAIRSSSVEQCHCPPPYIGLSCQQCAPGYYRVQTGSFLGACVPCECNGHSGTCDPETGICSECQHSTHGDYCELCEEGHYGDATTGSPYSCMPCSCPYSPSNNFARSCEVSEIGQLLSCNCKEGYSGERCDRCDAGYFGEPQRVGGSCQPCNCNNNNNLTDSRSCHPIIGDCFLCENNTDGRHCERCTTWFYGDAIGSKNCEACSCNRCGSAICDNRTGHCECKTNVEGNSCDRCKPDHWGFVKCRGCEACLCGIASSSSQCHSETGQCACRPGAAGQRCQHCEHGYWDYGEHGCRKCDCEADLSMGTVCDVMTGQCHCQEGATGSRCDQCQPSYLRIPIFGCRRCDECVHHLMKDVSSLNYNINILNTSISNISSATIVGARLSRNRKNMFKYNALLNLLSVSDEEYGNFLGDARAVLFNKSLIFNIANRFVCIEVSAGLIFKIASEIVNSIKNLALSIGSHSSVLTIGPKWIEDAEHILRDLESVSADNIPELVEDLPKKIDILQISLKENMDKMDKQKSIIRDTEEKHLELVDYLINSQKLLNVSKLRSDESYQATRNLSTFKLEGLVKALSDDIDKLIEEQKSASDIQLQVFNLTELTKDFIETIGNSRVSLVETRAELGETMETRREKKEAPINLSIIVAKAADLEDEAARLNRTFGTARVESQNAVDAALAYKNLTDSLNNARTKAIWVENEVTELSEGLQEKKTRVAMAVNHSTTLLKQASYLHQNVIEELKKEALEVERNVDQLTVQLDGMRRAGESVRSILSRSLNESTFDDIHISADHVKSLLQDSKKLSALTPNLLASFAKMHQFASNRTAHVDACSEKIAHIKELIAVARDAANRIKLGAHFEHGSSIDLNIPLRVSQSAVHTDISFHFKTSAEHGIPLFFGNEAGSAGIRAVPTDDYIAVEIEYRRPKIIIDLGEGPLIVSLTTRVSDGQWRQLSIIRIGKTATVTLYKPNSSEVSKQIQNRDFEGDIEDLQLHGEPIGLWNAKQAGMVNVHGAKRPRTMELITQPGISLNGDGYIVYKMGYWNPRKRTIFSISFLTFSPDGLLFFVGKDRDFLALELSTGSVRLSLDFGSGVSQWSTTGSSYNDGIWHTVMVTRDERHVKMDVDGNMVSEADSAGKDTDLSVTDYYYLGGTPAGVNTLDHLISLYIFIESRSPVEPLRGCIKSVRLGAEETNLHASYASKGVRNACPLGTVNTVSYFISVSILSDRSSAIFHNLTAKDDLEVTLKFKTRERSGTLLGIMTEDEDLLSLKIDDGLLSVVVGEDRLFLNLTSASDEQWHYVSVRKGKTMIRVDVDDLYSNESKRNNGEEMSPGEIATIWFGKHESTSFVGCIGDVTYNGELLDFAKAEVREVSLTGCSLADDVIKTTISSPILSSKESKSEKVPAVINESLVEKNTHEFALPKTQVRPDGSCALKLTPYGVLKNSEGTRFGLFANSRLEYEVAPDTFDKRLIFYECICESIIKCALFYFYFYYQTTLRSNTSILDGEWHNVKATRRGNTGYLIVDEESVEGVTPHGTDSIDTQPPLYLGGIPNELASYARTLIPGVKTEFGGCIRELSLNDKKFEGEVKSYNVVPCNTYVENGLYFGAEGGYAILKKEFQVGQTFSAEMEVRPRIQHGVIFSVGVLEYLTVQFLNGSIKFTVDSGSGAESLIYIPPVESALCDGHWHSIKIMKKKNLMTLTVDGKSNLNIMKKSKKPETVTKDPIYLGGLPEGITNKGLETRDGYVGCVRIINFGGGKKEKERKKKQLDASKLDVYGNVNKQECPVN
uniref:Laminin EGF-like domain-containing protein n=1 Tax=Heterorhabditis bacteriophora TaxID=37862 RepID=A0A1I7XHB3_HETBA